MNVSNQVIRTCLADLVFSKKILSNGKILSKILNELCEMGYTKKE